MSIESPTRSGPASDSRNRDDIFSGYWIVAAESTQLQRVGRSIAGHSLLAKNARRHWSACASSSDIGLHHCLCMTSRLHGTSANGLCHFSP